LNGVKVRQEVASSVDKEVGDDDVVMTSLAIEGVVEVTFHKQDCHSWQQLSGLQALN